MGLSFTIAAGPRQRSHSRVRVPRDSWPYFNCLRFETPPTWRARSPYLYPPGTGWPSYSTGFPFRRLLRLAGLRWRYSNLPPTELLSRNGNWPSLRVTLPLPVNRCFCSSTVFAFGKYATMSHGGLWSQRVWNFCLCCPLMCEPVSG
jgi:hypothetical protein